MTTSLLSRDAEARQAERTVRAWCNRHRFHYANYLLPGNLKSLTGLTRAVTVDGRAVEVTALWDFALRWLHLCADATEGAAAWPRLRAGLLELAAALGVAKGADDVAG